MDENRVGGEVEAKCGRCKALRLHRVIAMVDGLPRRVECLSCHAVHNYHPIAAPRSPRRAPARTATRRKSSMAERILVPMSEVVEYSPTGTYRPEQVLRHTLFGLGVITEVGTRTIVVEFEDKTRRLYLQP